MANAEGLHITTGLKDGEQPPVRSYSHDCMFHGPVPFEYLFTVREAGVIVDTYGCTLVGCSIRNAKVRPSV